ESRFAHTRASTSSRGRRSTEEKCLRSRISTGLLQSQPEKPGRLRSRRRKFECSWFEGERQTITGKGAIVGSRAVDLLDWRQPRKPRNNPTAAAHSARGKRRDGPARAFQFRFANSPALPASVRPAELCRSRS